MAGGDARQVSRGSHALRAWLDRTDDVEPSPSGRDLAGPFHYLWWLARAQGRRIVAAAVLGTSWMAALALTPWVLSRAIDDGLVGRDTSALVDWAVVLLGVTVLTALLSIARHRTMSKIRMEASFASVRVTVRHAARLGADLAGRVSAGEVVTVGIADVHTVSQALTVAGPGIGAVVAYGAVAVVLFTLSPVLAAVILAGVPLLAVAVGPFLQRVDRHAAGYRVEQGRLTTRLVDALAGLHVLNGLGGKSHIAQRYDAHSQLLVQRGYRVAGPSAWVGALSTGLPGLFLAAVVWLSARMAAGGTITIGDLVAVYGYVAMLVVPVAALIEGGGDLARARVAGRRIVDLLTVPVTRPGQGGRASIPAGCGPLVDAESGIIVRPGLLTALVAAHPAHTAAAIERLGGLTTSHGVTWAGVPLGEIPRAQLRRRLLLADNDADLFADTVGDIVAGRRDRDDDRLHATLEAAVAEDVVQALPGGLNAAVAAGGRDLSGGQRQRLRLARALYAGPDILLALDPTSAVDATTEAAMIEGVRRARHGRTTVITTTSPLAADRADEVIALTDGRVSAVGTHRQLMRDDAGYRGLMTRTTQAEGSR